MSRFVLTLVLSRIVRIICFLLTVLPSPKPGCYLRRFPPVPSSWTEFIRVGFREMMGRGGCNDLIFRSHSFSHSSSHSIIYSVVVTVICGR